MRKTRRAGRERRESTRTQPGDWIGLRFPPLRLGIAVLWLLYVYVWWWLFSLSHKLLASCSCSCHRRRRRWHNRSSGVNHVLIFELDPRNHLSEQHLMELAAILGVIWTLSVLSFLYSDNLSIPAYVNPLALVVIMALFMLNPTKTFRHEARFWMLRVLGRIVCAPFFYVGFADFWVADQLNSLAPALSDFHYLICFYTNPNATVNGN